MAEQNLGRNEVFHFNFTLTDTSPLSPHPPHRFVTIAYIHLITLTFFNPTPQTSHSPTFTPSHPKLHTRLLSPHPKPHTPLFTPPHPKSDTLLSSHPTPKFTLAYFHPTPPHPKSHTLLLPSHPTPNFTLAYFRTSPLLSQELLCMQPLVMHTIHITFHPPFQTLQLFLFLFMSFLRL